MTQAAQLTRREAYTPWPFVLDEVVLRFELDPLCTRVTSRLSLRRQPGADPGVPLWLAGRSLTLLRLSMDGVDIAPECFVRDESGLSISGVQEACSLEVVTELAPANNHSGTGLFLLDGTLATHMEAEGISRVTYFPDRPDVLSRYTVTLVADPVRYPVLLSNGNRRSDHVRVDGRHEVVWHDPHPKPSYIFALVAGDLGCLQDRYLTRSGRAVRIALYAPQRFMGQCGFAMSALQRAMRWDEDRYGLECDIDDYQVAALPGFPGAQENKGLNLFELAGILADPDITTDDEALTIERIIAHEYFHNWTGNRVTCRDWFQLSLKEGLTRFRDQCYTDDLLGSGAYRIDTVRTMLRNQFPEDDGPSRHPIRPETYADVGQLYTATVYEKGAEVIRMLHTLLGAERFVAGVRSYLQTFDGQAVTTDDFVDVMERVGGRDLGQFRRWYAQAGRPRLSVQREFDSARGRLSLTLSQQLPGSDADAAVMHIPVRLSLVLPGGAPTAALRRLDGGDPALLELTSASQRFVLEAVAPDAVPSLLEGFSAPVSVEPYLSGEEQLALLAHANDAYARWQAAQNVMTATVRRMAGAHRQAQDMDVPEPLLAAFETVLTAPMLNRLLTAELLRVTDEPMLSEGMPEIDVDGHATARNALRSALGHRLKTSLLAAVMDPGVDDRALMNVAGMGRRRLAAVSLDLLCATGDPAMADLCLERVQHGATMTERFDALICLVDQDGPQRDKALAAFYARWKDNPTVVNKWFGAQALCRLPDAVDRVMALQGHPAFDVTNIAQAMAYFGGFFRQNRIAFHHPSGRGYEWLVDLLLASDRMGRSGLSWLTPQIAQWRRHQPARQALMRVALARLDAAPGKSNGLAGLAQRLLHG